MVRVRVIMPPTTPVPLGRRPQQWLFNQLL